MKELTYWKNLTILMLNEIKRNPELIEFLKEECADEGICVDIDPRVSEFLVVKVDDYYNSLNLETTPAAPDCLIIIKCQNNGYALVIVELKNINTASRFSVENLTAKFNTCFDDFMTRRFANFFDQDFERIELFFVSKVSVYSHRRNVDLSRGLRLEALISKRFIFRSRRYMIKPHNPTPLVKPCYG